MSMQVKAKKIGLASAAAIVLASGMAQATEYRNIATASTTGAFYPIGGVVASILTNNMDGYNFTAEATGGSVENARLIGSGESYIGFFGGDTLWHANQGTGPFEGRPKVPLSPIAKIYGMPLHFVVMESSGIETVRDFKDKVVAVGAPGSGTESKAQAVLEGAGYSYGESITARYLNFREGADALVDRNVDAVVISVGVPSGNVQEIAASHNVSLAGIDDEHLEMMLDRSPYLEKYVIPGGTYNNIDEDVQTVMTATYIAVHKDADEDEVYSVCMTLFGENFDRFKASHAALQDVSIDDYPEGIMPLHPGAERCYQDLNII